MVSSLDLYVFICVHAICIDHLCIGNFLILYTWQVFFSLLYFFNLWIYFMIYHWVLCSCFSVHTLSLWCVPSSLSLSAWRQPCLCVCVYLSMSVFRRLFHTDLCQIFLTPEVFLCHSHHSSVFTLSHSTQVSFNIYVCQAFLIHIFSIMTIPYLGK